MARARKARPEAPKNPVSEKHLAEFDSYVEKWRALLNLRDWRIVRAAKREARNMAAVLTVEHEHKLARYAVGVDFGAMKVTPRSLESTALHEVLHIFLRPLMDTCIAEKGYTAQTNEIEHAAIIVLEDLLSKAYASKAA